VKKAAWRALRGAKYPCGPIARAVGGSTVARICGSQIGNSNLAVKETQLGEASRFRGALCSMFYPSIKRVPISVPRVAGS
jgi:hypothetical protein